MKEVISGMLPEARQKQIPDVPAIVKCLVNEQAIVVGSVRRPPAGHQIVRDAPVRYTPLLCLHANESIHPM